MAEYEARLTADSTNYRIVGRKLSNDWCEVTVLKEKALGVFIAVYEERSQLFGLSVMSAVLALTSEWYYDLAELGFTVRRLS